MRVMNQLLGLRGQEKWKSERLISGPASLCLQLFSGKVLENANCHITSDGFSEEEDTDLLWYPSSID